MKFQINVPANARFVDCFAGARIGASTRTGLLAVGIGVILLMVNPRLQLAVVVAIDSASCRCRF